jgi:anthranilate synthase component II
LKTLLIDNYDSFTYNLYQYIGELGGNPVVFKNDEVTLEQVRGGGYCSIVFSPGPGRPDVAEDVGICLDVILDLYRSIPMLGVCLGMQMMVYAFGGVVMNAERVMHGKSSVVRHSGVGLFEGAESSFVGMRYHSLVVEERSLPLCFEADGKSIDMGEVMAVRHREFPVYGVQFHPESIGTPGGKCILRNFLVT